MNSMPDTIDPATLVESLDPETIRARLVALHDQQKALRVLLRAANARRRSETAPPRKEAASCE